MNSITTRKNIMIIAGEASGDQHAAHLIDEFMKKANQNIDYHFYGVGGKEMKAKGVDILFDLTPYSVIGLTDVATHFKTYYRVFHEIIDSIKNNPPDLVVFVDAPGFNLRLAKKIKPLDIKTLYYISPQIWAWKAKRIKLIKKTIDAMAVILPFEKIIYDKAQVPAYFVGHPLLAKVKVNQSSEELKKQLSLDPNKRQIALLPGSRKKELTRLLPTMLQAADLLAQEYDDLQFVLPLAQTLEPSAVEKYLADCHSDIKIVNDATYEALTCCHCALVCSGTASLETALLNIPMVIVYKTSVLTALIGWFVMKIDFIGLPNILAEKEIVPELIQYDATAKKMKKEIARYLDDKVYYESVKQSLSKLAYSLDEKNSEDSLSDVIAGLLGIGFTAPNL